jgi:phosphatidylinositol phospholipase C epsilon
MSFLVVHDVSERDPYAILKVTSESTAQDVIRMALEKVGKANRLNEFVLVEEVAAAKEGTADLHAAPISQRLVGMEENPLSVRAQWKTDGKFVLRRVGEDPSWRARLMGRERRASTMPPFGRTGESPGGGDLAQVPELQEGGAGGGSEGGDPEAADTFLVCIFNVSPGVAHTILRVPRISTAADVIVTALNKSRGGSRIVDAKDFVLIEETEVVAGSLDSRRRPGASGGGGSGKKQLVQRVLAEDENVYLVQSSWAGGGKLTLLEREKNLARLRSLDPHPSIRETQSDPCPRTSVTGSPRMRRPNNLVGRVRRFSRSLYAEAPTQQLEVVSDGDVSDDDEVGGGRGGRKSSIANFRKLKIW